MASIATVSGPLDNDHECYAPCKREETKGIWWLHAFGILRILNACPGMNSSLEADKHCEKNVKTESELRNLYPIQFKIKPRDSAPSLSEGSSGMHSLRIWSWALVNIRRNQISVRGTHYVVLSNSVFFAIPLYIRKLPSAEQVSCRLHQTFQVQGSFLSIMSQWI